MTDELTAKIVAKLDGYGHAGWCQEPCSCSPEASRADLAAAVRDVLDLCDDDDPPPVAAFMAESIRLAVAFRLGILDGDAVNRRLLAVVKRLGMPAPGEVTL